MLLVLGIIYKAISDALQDESTLGNGLDVAMLVVLVGSFVGPILWSVRQEQTITRVLDSFSLVEMLLRAEKQIDGPIRERLAADALDLVQPDPQGMARFIADDTRRWQDLARSHGIRVDEGG